MTALSYKLCLKLIGTSLISTKHPIYGGNQLTIEQLRKSSGEYKTKLYQEIISLIKRDIIIVDCDNFKLV